jgi:hypothetical protein
MRNILTWFSLLLFASSAGASGRDGSWWVTKPFNFKLTYVVGMLDGVTQGVAFTVQPCLEMTEDRRVSECVKTTTNAYFKEINKYIVDKDPNSFVAAVDAYYADVRNRDIPASEIFSWVVKATRGEVPDQRVVEQTRKIFSSKHQ